ncbi:ClpP/crotonase-like domain-containing protein [Fimicolochytrium jonesii]|uniref:ClpP/crotonase-like domain-containing protein n=1 Tax=Fimicolochytrium jonesii TaxID=1396493 RepID=UPI0022FDBB1B|nr:ClpP/crotonase-like domain-containing protein [Fimicolochytrium jonesii]KAI8825602.1 ClpP/crotonase-like domain-containing protein [Fimicolochytrium jonesii]
MHSRLALRSLLCPRLLVVPPSAPRLLPSIRAPLKAISPPRRLNSTVAAEASAEAPECYLERLQGADKGIVLLNFNRPAAKNALGKTFMKQFRDALQELRFDEGVRCIIVKSLVPGVFCAGADLKERVKMSPVEVAAFVHGLRTAFADLESLPVPTIAAVDGAALGGGLEVALSTDIRVAGMNAKLGLPETKLAIIPGAGGTQRLPRLIGIPRAKELIFTARVMHAREAAEIGLVNHAVEGVAADKALEIARSIIKKGPIAIRAAKLAIERGSQLDMASGLAFEQTCYAQVIPTEDRLEGLRAFKEKREPVYKGR